MKYMIGYQISPDKSLISAIVKNRKDISELYFSWDDFPNGRNVFVNKEGYQAFEIQAHLVDDLQTLSEAGIKLNLLLNANCYGRLSLSKILFNKIGNTIDYIHSRFDLHSVTTTSPVIAKFVKNNFSELEIRASVNMEIGTVQGMDYIADYFDAYYMKRELNRNIKAITELKRWSDANNKKLYMLANSGCLNHCSAHNFHDNLVAHENGIKAVDNAFEFRGTCHDYLRSKEKQLSIIKDSNYVRPEDIYLYEDYFDAVKLATRINHNPVAVLNAYIKGHYSGNVMELLEPNHAESFYPLLIENSRFPEDYAQKIMNCNKNCSECGYCLNVFNKVKININEGF